MEIGKGIVLREGHEVAVLCYGPLVYEALQVAEDLDVAVVNMRFAKPLDTALLDELSTRYSRFVTIEDGTRIGGFGSAVAEYISAEHPGIRVSIMGVPDRIVEHGSPKELYREVGLDAEGIAAEIRRVQPVLSTGAHL
jgi:1-deoxy-D-xylulose-5-phosphate synthase